MAKKSLGEIIVRPLLYLVSVMLIVILQFGFIFILLALLPSIVTHYTDRDSRLSAFRSVFACNLAGLMPYLVPMMASGLRMKHYDVGSLMGNPQVWLVIYGSAALGWCMLFISNYIAHFFLEIQYQYKAAALERAQKKLLEEWGESIRPLEVIEEPSS